MRADPINEIALMPKCFYREVKEDAAHKLGELERQVDSFTNIVEGIESGFEGLDLNHDNPWAIGSKVKEIYEHFMDKLNSMHGAYIRTVSGFFTRQKQVLEESRETIFRFKQDLLDRIQERIDTLSAAFNDYTNALATNIEMANIALKRKLKDDEAHPKSIGEATKTAFVSLMHSAIGSTKGRAKTFELYADRFNYPLSEVLAETKEIDLADYFSKRQSKWSSYFKYLKGIDLELETSEDLGKFWVSKRAFSFIVDYAIWFILRKAPKNESGEAAPIKLRVEKDEDELKIELIAPQIESLKLPGLDDPNPTGPENFIFPNQVFKEMNITNLLDQIGGDLEARMTDGTAPVLTITIPENLRGSKVDSIDLHLL